MSGIGKIHTATNHKTLYARLIDQLPDRNSIAYVQRIEMHVA